MRSESTPTATFRDAFGPGLMWAAAAIGVSHLVQSTRAGAMAGFGLAGVILLALVIKYPFFEYGPRYRAPTSRRSPCCRRSARAQRCRRPSSWRWWGSCRRRSRPRR